MENRYENYKVHLTGYRKNPDGGDGNKRGNHYLKKMEFWGKYYA